MKQKNKEYLKSILILFVIPLGSYTLVVNLPDDSGVIVVFFLWLAFIAFYRKTKDEQKDIIKCLDLIMENPERIHRLSKEVNDIERIDTWSDEDNVEHLRNELRSKIRKETKK